MFTLVHLSNGLTGQSISITPSEVETHTHTHTDPTERANLDSSSELAPGCLLNAKGQLETRSRGSDRPVLGINSSGSWSAARKVLHHRTAFVRIRHMSVRISHGNVILLHYGSERSVQHGSCVHTDTYEHTLIFSHRHRRRQTGCFYRVTSAWRVFGTLPFGACAGRWLPVSSARFPQQNTSLVFG